jgi:hypothetical protein
MLADKAKLSLRQFNQLFQTYMSRRSINAPIDSGDLSAIHAILNGMKREHVSAALHGVLTLPEYLLSTPYMNGKIQDFYLFFYRTAQHAIATNHHARTALMSEISQSMGTCDAPEVAELITQYMVGSP